MVFLLTWTLGLNTGNKSYKWSSAKNPQTVNNWTRHLHKGGPAMFRSHDQIPVTIPLLYFQTLSVNISAKIFVFVWFWIRIKSKRPAKCKQKLQMSDLPRHQCSSDWPLWQPPLLQVLASLKHNDNMWLKLTNIFRFMRTNKSNNLPWFLMASWDVCTFGRCCCSILARAAAPALCAPPVGVFLGAPRGACGAGGSELQEKSVICGFAQYFVFFFAPLDSRFLNSCISVIS